MNHFKMKNNKLEKLRGIFFYIGLIVAGGLTLVAFEWTFPIQISQLGGVIIEETEWDLDYVDPFEMEKEEIIEEKIEPPKIDYKEIEIVPDKHKEKELDKTEEKKQAKELNFDEGKWGTKEKIVEPEPPKSFAQYMPHYENCKSLEEDERKKCTQEKMYKHFGKKIRVPEIIKLEGKATYRAFVYFEVNKKGEIVNVKIRNKEKNKIPRELERQAYNAVASLPDMIPGKHNGKNISIQYTLPIKFKIN